ncbi:preprotein translocase subunit SecG [Candidatus Microgenomates bacterium]|nr:preprotein translocase subunit SecG [Candidatus Microgenomates bacterium]
MKEVLTIIEIVVAVALVATVLLQVKGTGLGSTFGGGGELYQSKRGVEKIVFYATIALAAVFGLLSLLLIALP